MSIPTWSLDEPLPGEFVSSCRRCGGVYVKASMTAIDEWFCCDMCIDRDTLEDDWTKR